MRDTRAAACSLYALVNETFRSIQFPVYLKQDREEQYVSYVHCTSARVCQYVIFSGDRIKSLFISSMERNQSQ